mgnify:CR=1 FL=1
MVPGARPSAGRNTLRSPGADTTVNRGVHVNFQPASVTAPGGYSADTGAAFNGLAGWQNLTGAPLDLTANTRVRHSASALALGSPTSDCSLRSRRPSLHRSRWRAGTIIQPISGN